ncbi:MAG TPA: histidine phosphatase family protein [Acidimicrobiales bacterium]|nr:histidine phosphatase family protein [Acidimicrobiales bacterium]
MTDALWPSSLLIVRHGESAGNVARDKAEAEGLPMIDIVDRDMDVPLSRLGERQATALGQWIADLPSDEQPTVVYTSPYVRARETASRALEAAGRRAEDEVTLVIDERLREREFGVLDRLTRRGITERYPEQAAFRAHLGKFYHRPPGGESWADVILRLRSFIDTISRECRGERILVVSHQVVVLMFRYILEHLSEQEILAIDRDHDLANCSVTSYALEEGPGGHGQMALRLFNHVAPLEAAGEAVTTEPDVPVGAGGAGDAASR